MSDAGYVSAVAELGARNVPPGGELALAQILDEIPRAPKLILDIGCNTGWVTLELARRFPTSRVVGVDLDPLMISAARGRARSARLTKRVSFLELDCTQMGSSLHDVDFAISAGSTAFVRDRDSMMRELSKVLREGGIFVDMNYVYQKPLSQGDRRAEQKHFGLAHGGETLDKYLRSVGHPDMPLERYEDLGPYSLPKLDDQILKILLTQAGKQVEATIRRLLKARNLAEKLAPHRRAGAFTFRRPQASATPIGRTPGHRGEFKKCMKVLDLFHTPVPRQPIDVIAQLNPYEFLAYIGDPDAAPGGSRSVALASRQLQAAGCSRKSRVLDIGSFTGLSTIVLGASFPQVLGIDIDPDFVRIASTLGRGLGSSARFMLRDGRKSGFARGSFDAVVLTATLGYSSDPGEIVCEARRLLRRGGFFVEFLYDYAQPSRELADFLQRTVSPYIKVRKLADQLADIQSQGFRCRSIQAVGDSRLPAESLQEMQRLLAHREAIENPNLGKDGLRIFTRLLEDYVTGTPPGPEPACYLCVFEAE